MWRSAPFWYRNFPRLTFMARKIARANPEREMGLLDALCDRTKTGIDVGAKVGMYSYRIRDRSSDVVIFEPNPLFNYMLGKVFNGKRGRVEPYAVSSTRGTATMRLPFEADGTRQFGRATIEAANPLQHEQVARTEEITVETRTIDEYGLQNVGFIKIDVEGHELAVLDGAVQTLAANQPMMLIECNDDHQPDGTGKLRRWLDAHGYDAFFVEGQQLRPMDQYVHATHWRERGIENFICIPRSAAPQVRERVAAAAAKLR